MTVTRYELSRDMRPEEWPAEIVAASDYDALSAENERLRARLDIVEGQRGTLTIELRDVQARLAEADRVIQSLVVNVSIDGRERIAESYFADQPPAAPPFPDVRDVIERHARQIEMLCDEAGLDPYQWLADTADKGTAP